MLRNRVYSLQTFRYGIAVMKGLRFVGTKETCFDAWKLSHMGYAALLCGLFGDVQEIFLSLKNYQIWPVSNWKVAYLRIVRNGAFRLGNVQTRAVPSRKMVDLVMLRNCVFRLRNVQIWVVPY